VPISLPTIFIALTLLALVAASVQPSVTASDLDRLQASTQQLATLLRTAQSEAQRTAIAHGVVYDPTNTRFDVVLADTSVEPFASLSPAYHPTTKQPLHWSANQWVRLTPNTGVFSFGQFGTADRITFDAWGNPALVVGGLTRQLTDTQITLATGQHSLNLTIDAFTGRVTIPNVAP